MMTVSVIIIIMLYLTLFSVAKTFIGFSQRNQVVSESDALPGTYGFHLPVPIHSSGSESRDFPVNVRVLPAAGNSTVEATNTLFNPAYDALFGTKESIHDPIQENLVVVAGSRDLQLVFFIRNDFLPEGLECFTLELRGSNAEGYRTTSDCYDDGGDLDATDYFCKQTICIEDDDDG